ncbi:wax ester/triacylglycerol synthase family O-acyltransferase [Segeticoccus rhizosphaerae]|jgi:WS/DGAT/MGAT family acyltransferase|uniref:wax ester/triacylglycerol synthase family O-acyltransferase n=1 Tax=Segeticoccus rhizosphaerae TaxID=1104777 RepID=UPI0010BFF33A|nr:wax ester/triacylglycerol synthase family O-acyltransferase [Ornithinicoccus soli]
MQQLTAMDGMFFSVDTATSTGVMGGLMIYDAFDDPAAGRAERMIERITERLDQIPPFRRVRAKVPLGLDKEYWAETEVDVAAHVRTITLAEGGTDQDLAAEISRIMSIRLDPHRPLWELWIIEGLHGGRLAHLLRVHHGAVDGGTIPTILDLLSDHPTTPADPASAAPGRREPWGGPVEMLARGVVGRALKPVQFVGLQAQTVKYLVGRRSEDGVMALPAFIARMIPGKVGAPVRGVVNRRQRAKGQPEVLPVLPQVTKPATPFNRTITDARTYAFSDLSLADFKRVGKAFDGTMNDAVVAVVAGALRRWMEERGGAPEEPLVVCIPYSLRTGEEKDRWANHISMFFAPLPTHLADPVERLKAVHGDLKAARSNFDALPTGLLRSASRFIPQSLFWVHQQLLSRAPDWVSGSMWNVVVSNVRGPSQVVEVTGARMAGYWPAAFLTTGVGLNITLQSYLDRVDFGFMGAGDLTGDLWELPGHMKDALEELMEAADRAESAAKSPAPRKLAAKKSPAPRKSAAKKSPAPRKSAAKKSPAPGKSAARKSPAAKKSAAKPTPTDD